MLNLCSPYILFSFLFISQHTQVLPHSRNYFPFFINGSATRAQSTANQHLQQKPSQLANVLFHDADTVRTMIVVSTMRGTMAGYTMQLTRRSITLSRAV